MGRFLREDSVRPWLMYRAAKIPSRVPGEAGFNSCSLPLQGPIATGDLEAIAHGQMLATMTPVEGSAAYVALDRETGSPRGRS